MCQQTHTSLLLSLCMSAKQRARKVRMSLPFPVTAYTGLLTLANVRFIRVPAAVQSFLNSLSLSLYFVNFVIGEFQQSVFNFPLRINSESVASPCSDEPQLLSQFATCLKRSSQF